MNIELKILDKKFYQYHENRLSYALPSYATTGSAGMDLRITKDISLSPNEIELVGTGVAIHIGSMSKVTGWHEVVGFIYPRSSVMLSNGVGVIDQDYQGEIKISLWNPSDKIITLLAGDRVAQIVFMPIIKVEFNIVNEFSVKTERGDNGWGSTGK